MKTKGTARHIIWRTQTEQDYEVCCTNEKQVWFIGDAEIPEIRR
jgi:hypothetical protein